MSTPDRHKKNKPENDPPIDPDHFYQLVMMDERTRKAWKRSHPDPDVPDQEQQKRLSEERSKLITQKSTRKTSKK